VNLKNTLPRISPLPRSNRGGLLVRLALLAFLGVARAQDEPPSEVPLVEKPWDELSNKEVSPDGEKALAIAPEKWKHAETDNFILHYRRVTEAHKVAREIEYDIWFVAKTLGATPDKYKRKSHVFIFEDDTEWQNFLADTEIPSWAGSFAVGDELFLNVRRSETTGRFDSQTLAHETTHAVVARLYTTRWPLWLSEGFAEYMGSASVAARKNETVRGRQHVLEFAGLSLDQLTAMTRYPDDPIVVTQLYESAEKLVRFIMNDLPKERFLSFVDAILSGSDLKDAVLKVYGDKFKDFDEFEKKYDRFTK